MGFCATAPGSPLEPSEAELIPVRLILARRAAGVPFRAIAAELRAAGLPSKRAGAWRSETVRKVWLRRKRYAGCLGGGA